MFLAILTKERTCGFVVVLLVGLLEGAAAQEAAAPELRPLERYLGVVDVRRRRQDARYWR